MTTHDPTLADLGDDELTEAGLALGQLVQELTAAGYPRAAAWARFEAYRVANELTRRANLEPEPLPPMVTLSDLAPTELRRLRDHIHVVATLEAADGEASAAARWWQALYGRVVAAIDTRQRDAEPLRAWLREHPINHDASGLPSWKDISS